MNITGDMHKDPHRYDDMLDLPHHQSAARPPMPETDRAAQFSPFAALTGYDDEVRETARLTYQRIELDESSKALLDERLRYIIEHLQEHPVVSFTYFVADNLKDGGAYVTTASAVKKVDFYGRKVILYAANEGSAETEIPIDDIVAITGDLFTFE